MKKRQKKGPISGPIPESYRLKAAQKIIKNLYGSKAEMWGQFEMIAETEEFHRKYPGVIGKDITTIIKSWLSKN